MSTGILALPSPHDPDAPTFTGDDNASLLEFLDYFDVLVQECELSTDEQCRYILKYVDVRMKQLWLTLDGYESRDFQKFRDEIIYQYPYAQKVARQRVSQLTHRSTDDVNCLVHSMRSPSVDDPTHAVAHPRLSEPSPTAVPYRPAPVSSPTCPVRAVPVHAVPIYAVPTPAVHHVCTILVVGQDHAVSVARPVIPVPAAARHAHATPVSRPIHAVDRPDHAAPVLDHAALTFCFDLPAPPQFTFRPTFVPIVSSPTLLPFPLCPTSAPSAFVMAQVQPSPIEITHQAVPSVSHEPCKVNSDARHTPVDVQKQEAGRLSHRCKIKEDVAIQKEEGRGQQAVVQPNDNEHE